MAQVITTNINLEDSARVIKALDSKIAELKELREEKVAEVKEVMTKANVFELKAGSFTFRLQEISSNWILLTVPYRFHCILFSMS